MRKVYVIMCLGEIVSNTCYENEIDAIREVRMANAEFGGDFWYKEFIVSK